MIRAALASLPRGVFALAIMSGACGRAEGVADQELGNLVVDTKVAEKPIDLDAAAKDPAELSRALMRPYRSIVAALPAHTLTLASKTTVEEAGKITDDLGESTVIQLGDAAAFHGEYTNTADYGREITFVGGKLYLRPRYQRWHVRAPETADEPAALRDGLFAPIAATWDLLAPAAELTDLGPAQVAGRTGRKIAIKLSPAPRANPRETVTQKKWREQRTIEELTGEVVLDVEKGAPLAVKLAGAIGFQRDGRRFRMRVSLTSEVTGLGTAVAITAPAETEVVATPERLREVDDRDYLLQGIAPPLRKAPDGATPAPAPAPDPAPAPAKPGSTK
ncbi:MAG: hypothetical protein IPQ07_41995 [Myxococcales bacterium]|nr:hypothetical protein [Myxococcales bacterium]